MSNIIDLLFMNFEDATDVAEFEFLDTEQKNYDAPAIAMASSLEGFTPVPSNLNRLSRWSDTTRLSKGGLLLSLANLRRLKIRGGAKAFGHHNKMRVIEKADRENFRKVGRRLLKKSGNLVALSSRVRVIGGEMRHFVLIDFACRNDEYGKESARMVIERMGLRGALIDSGRSFHFYSKDHFSFSEWVEKMGEALLYSPLTDGAWIAHQLIENRSALRISTKHKRELTLVSHF